MHRAQILLDEWQYEVLKSLSEREGRSISEIVRKILDERFRRSGGASKDPLIAIEGIADQPGTYGKAHDEVLYGKK